MSGSIIRVSKPDRYAVIHHDLLRDKRLSFGARGLLSYLLSRPDNWTVQVADLIEQSPAGRDAVYGMLKELETHHYLKREKKNGPGGKIEWDMTVYELPYTAQPSTAKPYTAKPDTVQPDTAKPNHKKERSEERTKEEVTRKPPPSVRERAIALLDRYAEIVKPIDGLHPATRSKWLTLIEVRLREDWADERLELAWKGCALDEWLMTKGFNGVPDILTERDRTERLIELARKGTGNGKHNGQAARVNRGPRQPDTGNDGEWAVKNHIR